RSLSEIDLVAPKENRSSLGCSVTEPFSRKTAMIGLPSDFFLSVFSSAADAVAKPRNRPAVAIPMMSKIRRICDSSPYRFWAGTPSPLSYSLRGPGDLPFGLHRTKAAVARMTPDCNDVNQGP